MSKKICFNYEGEKYTLEFNAYALKKMEDNGFDFSKLDKGGVTIINQLFHGSFIANHETTSVEKIDEIYVALTNDSKGKKLNDAIVELLVDAINNITNNEGNVTWSMES